LRRTGGRVAARLDDSHCARCARRSGRPARPDPSPEERFATALEHARLALRLQGDTRKTALEFRKHFGWYTKGVAGAAKLREQLFQIESMQQAEAIFAAHLAGSTVEQAA